MTKQKGSNETVGYEIQVGRRCMVCVRRRGVAG
jgi:hypothetical protein